MHTEDTEDTEGDDVRVLTPSPSPWKEREAEVPSG